MGNRCLKIAFVHVGPVADKGWSWAHDQGAQYVKAQLGDAVEITTLESIPEGSDSQRVFEDLAADGQLMYGICLATDAEQYTQLSEKLTPEELRELMNRYYAVIFEPVRMAGGFVSDVVGDAVLALWAAKAPEPQIRQRACRAALAIEAGVEDFNDTLGGTRLPTRIGIHCGEVVIGHVGALDHYEYRAVGDIVNTATRIEGLNKQLGTRILVSAPILEGLEGYVSRRLGRFLLAGKSRPLEIHELMGAAGADDPALNAFLERFAAALRAFHARQWAEAADGFQACLDMRPQDGPAQLYVQRCHFYDSNPPAEDWDGTLRTHMK